jgi:hypothetical protein
MDGQAGKYRQDQIDLSLFDMKNDPYEKVNVIDQYPKVVDKLQQFVEQHQNKFYK